VLKFRMNGVIPPIPIRFRGVPGTLFRFILLKGFPETCNIMMFIVYGLGVGDFITSHPQGLGGGGDDDCIYVGMIVTAWATVLTCYSLVSL
jgi:hypothetical protein